MVLICFLVMISSCSRYVELPWTQYEDIEEDSTSSWRIHTKSGHVYEAARLSITDTTLVITEFAPTKRVVHSTGNSMRPVPFVLNRTEVLSIEKRAELGGGEKLLAMGFVIVIGLILIITYVIGPSIENLD
jgi:hypothetical protein